MLPEAPKELVAELSWRWHLCTTFQVSVFTLSLDFTKITDVRMPFCRYIVLYKTITGNKFMLPDTKVRGFVALSVKLFMFLFIRSTWCSSCEELRRTLIVISWQTQWGFLMFLLLTLKILCNQILTILLNLAGARAWPHSTKRAGHSPAFAVGTCCSLLLKDMWFKRGKVSVIFASRLEIGEYCAEKSRQREERVVGHRKRSGVVADETHLGIWCPRRF